MNSVNVPIFSYNPDGSILPNPVFHRSHDKLHSRCIEYPFAASRLGDAQKILDIGTIKSNKIWIGWLEGLPIEVHGTDYDKPYETFQNISFQQADVRNLPYDDNTFDKILAVSVIEHIGLADPQVEAEQLPEVGEDGDIVAVKELIRTLKPGGELVMTFPFSKHYGIFQNDARIYSIDRIGKFNEIADSVILDYYEYQSYRNKILYQEYTPPNKKSYFSRLIKMLNAKFGISKQDGHQNVEKADFILEEPGSVTWRRIPMENASSIQYEHIDGVLCGVWKKR